MTVESVTYISDLNSSYPGAGDSKSEGDDHLRNLKVAIKGTFPNVSGAVTPTHTELNYVDGVTSAIQTQLDAKAPAANPTFTGTVTLPSTTSIGSVSDTELGYVNGVTSAIQTQLDAKGAIAGQAWTGDHTFPTQTAGDNSTKVATTAYVDAAAAGTLTFVSSQTASSSASITFTGLTSGYDYVIEADGVYPASDGTILQVRMRNGGADDTGANYSYAIYTMKMNTTTATTGSYSGDTVFNICTSGMDNASTSRASFTIRIKNPSATTSPKMLTCEAMHLGATPTDEYAERQTWMYKSTSAVDGIKIYALTGNITAGTFNLYKIKRS